MTRRKFMGTLAKGVALLAGERALRASWAIAGSGMGSLRLVFYTDVHTRTEWEVPVAITRAAEAINSKKADLVIAGGERLGKCLWKHGKIGNRLM